jgi:threonine dehydrogenase-like Zn-dependent dehydrogenase
MGGRVEAMRAAVFHEPRRVEAGDRPDASLREPADAVVRVALACVCGTDLWFYRGDSRFKPGPIGHEFIGVVEDVGAEVQQVSKGDLVIASFMFCDNTCPHCRYGITSACINGGIYPTNGDGGQGEAVRVPLADGGLVRVPGSGHSDEMLASLLALSDVMSTGQHVAVCAVVRPGGTVAVVGDGAVGLSGVLAAKRLGAGRIIALSRHPDRQVLAKEFGATDIVEQRGDEAIQAVMELTDGVGVDATLECVGTGESFETAIAIRARWSAMSASRTASSCWSASCSPQQGRPRRLRAGARLHPRAAGRRPRRPHQPGPGARLRDRPGRHRRRLCRHGRAPRDQVPRARGDGLMSASSDDERRRIRQRLGRSDQPRAPSRRAPPSA